MTILVMHYITFTSPRNRVNENILELVWSYVSTWWLMVDSQVLCSLHQKMQTLIQLAIVEDRLVEKPGFTTFLIFTDDILVVMLNVKHLLTRGQVERAAVK